MTHAQLWDDLRTWTEIPDKTALWGPGPWAGEPDLAVGTDPVSGLPCLAVRHHRHGNWRGYVGISPGHRLHGVPYSDADLRTSDREVTYGSIYPPREGTGQPIDTWWFGFHCGHAWDIQPGRDARDVADGYGLIRLGSEQYRTLEYVQKQCVELAALLRTVR